MKAKQNYVETLLTPTKLETEAAFLEQRKQKLLKLDLRDDYYASGIDLESFAKEMQMLDDSTEIITLSTYSSLTFLSIFYKTEDGRYLCYNINENTMPFFEKGIFQKLSLPGHFNIKLLEETFQNCGKFNSKKMSGTSNGSGLMLKIGDRVFFMSSQAFSTLAVRAGMKGTKLNKPSLWRDLYLYERLLCQMENSKLVVRTINRKVKSRDFKESKVFAVLSDSFQSMDLSSLTGIANKLIGECTMGTTVVKKWESTHRISKLYLEFPEYGEILNKASNGMFDMIPGLLLMTSNTGDLAFTIKKTLRSPKSEYCCTQDGIIRKHSTKIDSSIVYDYLQTEYKKDIEKTVTFFVKKAKQRVYDCPLTSNREIKGNRQRCIALVRKWLKTLGLIRHIGKKRYSTIDIVITQDLNPEHPYTQYDMAQLIYQIPDIVISGPSPISLDRLEDLQSALFDLAYMSGDSAFEDADIETAETTANSTTIFEEVMESIPQPSVDFIPHEVETEEEVAIWGN